MLIAIGERFLFLLGSGLSFTGVWSDVVIVRLFGVHCLGRQAAGSTASDISTAIFAEAGSGGYYTMGLTLVPSA